ncbi:GNAT family N-acetyltransferase [Arsenicicoccus dermatophilus]|uniref:GNAT family N-acetyltransferase n=1 Tax=Arsenicicoccus dermatophilus TaxID=1076331 RepID=UPI001F4D34D8|nr:GNAT family N-acetyltransferase [Arsenicicoccus dermatophilus]MCH8612814.1 GNAT family N-acetyltransferase [Arsenicicoccus dermatophilus]
MRSAAKGITVSRTAVADDFRQLSATRISAAPVIHSVIATTLAHALEAPHDYPQASWYWARRDGRVTALAMHTPPRPFHVATVDPHVSRALARRAMIDQLEIPLVGGLIPGALAFAETLAFERGSHIRVVRREGMHDLPGLPRMPSGVPGALRPATGTDLPMLQTWAAAYLDDTRTPAPARFPLEKWVERGGMQLWEVDGEPVSMAHASRPHGGVSRVSWVYTPPEHRGHGYAAATVAEVSLRQRRAGHRCLLYTDLDHPESSRLYHRIGFRKVGDSCVLRLEAVRATEPTPAAEPPRADATRLGGALGGTLGSIGGALRSTTQRRR